MNRPEKELLERLLPCEIEELTLPQARQVAQALRVRPWFTFIGCRRFVPLTDTDEPSLLTICRSMDEVERAAASQDPPAEPAPVEEVLEAVFFEVEVEVPQFPVHPIRDREPLVALFFREEDGNVRQLTLAGREDFPLVPHIYGDVLGLGRSLCMWEESLAELRLTWTAERYFQRLREWLRLTARGELHASDQPLHPLLYPTRSFLVAPSSLFEPTETPEAGKAIGGEVRAVGDVQTFLVRPENVTGQNAFVVMALRGAALEHGMVEAPPKNLSELATLVARLQIDFSAELQKQFDAWHQKPKSYGSRIVWALTFPQVRVEGGPIERVEQHAFATHETVAQVAEKLGLWSQDDKGYWGRLFQPDGEHFKRAAPGVGLVSLNVTPLLSRDMAAQFNGTSPHDLRVVGIGAGALGSQTFLNLARGGWGQWHVVDRDVLLPHNGARHVLSGHFIGHPKAIGLCNVVNSLFDESLRATPLIDDVLAPHDELQTALQDADIVLDLSASLPVARALSHDFKGRARTASAFLNPSGSQLLILAQDAAKTITLADLEMQLWRAIIEDKEWKNYYGGQTVGVRYARSCGDRSSRISQELVAVHAANASRAVRGLSDDARIVRYHFDLATETQTRDEIAVLPVRVWDCGGWTLRASEGVLTRLRELRENRLPIETGGILLGAFDPARQIAYIVAVLPAPPDSEETRSSFLRGCAGLRAKVEAIQTRTGFQVGYLGEWHSHPPGRDSEPSVRDFEHFSHLQNERIQDGLPAVLLIIGDGDESAFVETMPSPPPETPIVLIIISQ